MAGAARSEVRFNELDLGVRAATEGRVLAAAGREDSVTLTAATASEQPVPTFWKNLRRETLFVMDASL